MEPTIQQDLKEMMDVWDKILEAAHEQFPGESEVKLFEIASDAMNHAIGLKKKAA